MRIGLVAAWYNFWVGANYDRARRRLYIQPLPCVGFWLERGQQTPGAGPGPDVREQMERSAADAMRHIRW
jgi:hypothetical protein